MKYLSEHMASWLIKHGAIPQEDRVLYEYATYSFIISILPLFIVMFFGVIQGKTVESILLIIPFMLIRKFSGGYHAKHSWVCIISSCAVLFLCVYIVSDIRYGMLLNIAMLCAAASLVALSPIDSENRRLDDSEKKQYKKITIIMVIVFVILYFLLSLLGNKIYSICIAEGIIITACLQVPCLLQKLLFIIKKKT